MFNKHTGVLYGFADLGKINQEIEVAVSGESEESATGGLAEQALYSW